MATIGAALTSSKNSSRISYISALPFNTVFLTYTVSTTNYVTTGTLTANVLNPTTGITVVAADCPAGRVLRETGRKLFPEANPGVTTCLVSVYDRITGATGFIDPNSPYFAIYNVDKANFLLQDTDEQVALGPPIFTGGVVTAGGLAILSKVTTGTTPLAAGASTAGTVALVTGAAVVNTTAASATSLIFLTNVATGGTVGVLSVARGTNTFTINSSSGTDTSTIAWLVIN